MSTRSVCGIDHKDGSATCGSANTSDSETLAYDVDYLLDVAARSPYLVREAAMALDYYRAAFLGRRPRFVPSRVFLPDAVRGYGGTFADRGAHDCSANQWGAISVAASNGSQLGLRPSEFVPLAWKPAEVRT